MLTVLHFVLLLLLLLCSGAHVRGLSDAPGVGRTPAMGWNSWNRFGTSISDTLIRQQTDAAVKNNLPAAGYRYINLDDAWQSARDGWSHTIQTDTRYFPDMKALATYIHSKGMLMGVYSDAGWKTCAGRPGSLGYEQIDANTYAAWGVDYLKYDNCNTDGSSAKTRYKAMSNALQKTNRKILFSICNWGQEETPTWAPALGQSWRTTTDISNSFWSAMGNIISQDHWWAYARPGGFNDPDMLEVGNGGMTASEERLHFALWCLAKAPLILGMDMRTISATTLSLITNKEAIAINQDPLGVQGHRVWSSTAKQTKSYSGGGQSMSVTVGLQEIWSALLSNGDIAVVLFNTNNAPASINLQFQNLGLPANANASIRDVLSQTFLGTYTGTYTAKNLGQNSGMFLRVSSPQPITCGVAEENSAVLLSCGANAGAVINSITFANYGRPSGTCDSSVINSTSSPFTADRTCSLDIRTTAITKCLNQTTCMLFANNDALGVDPCPGGGKRLAVSVTCAPGTPYEPQPQPLPEIITCDVVSEHNVLNLSCPSSDQVMTAVKFADYGLPVGSCDPSASFPLAADPTCSLNLNTLVTNKCLNHNTCSLAAENDILGTDPCPGNAKRLAVSISCTGGNTPQPQPLSEIITCDAVSEHSVLNLFCPNSTQVMTAIKFADYGLPVGSCDASSSVPFTADPSCTADIHTLVTNKCLNHSTCSLAAENSILGSDPCPGNGKRLAVSAICSSATATTTK